MTLTLNLAVKEVATTVDAQRIVLETPKKDRAALIAARVAKLHGVGDGPQPTPGMALVLPLDSALAIEPGAIITVTITTN